MNAFKTPVNVQTPKAVKFLTTLGVEPKFSTLVSIAETLPETVTPLLAEEIRVGNWGDAWKVLFIDILSVNQDGYAGDLPVEDLADALTTTGVLDSFLYFYTDFLNPNEDYEEVECKDPTIAEKVDRLVATQLEPVEDLPSDPGYDCRLRLAKGVIAASNMFEIPEEDFKVPGLGLILKASSFAGGCVNLNNNILVKEITRRDVIMKINGCNATLHRMVKLAKARKLESRNCIVIIGEKAIANDLNDFFTDPTKVMRLILGA